MVSQLKYMTLNIIWSAVDKDYLKFMYNVVKNTTYYKNNFFKETPKVSILTTTYNKCDLLLNYSLKSALNQTYENIEIIIVCDRCTDNTMDSLSNLKDDRIKYFNISHRPDYPDNPEHRWMIAGVYAYNMALTLCTGDFIAHLDDDDMFVDTRIEKLVKFSKENKYDIIHHPFSFEGCETIINSNEFVLGQITTSALFYHSWFKILLLNKDAYVENEPGDWNRFKNFKYVGASIGRYPEILTKIMPSTSRNF